MNKLNHIMGHWKEVFLAPKYDSSLALKLNFPSEKLEIYHSLVRSHLETSLDKMYPLFRSQICDGEWERLKVGYFQEYPSQHWELNKIVFNFPDYLQTIEGLSPYLLELVLYELTDFQVYLSQEDIVSLDQLSLNPTLVVRQYEYSIHDWVQLGDLFSYHDSCPIKKTHTLFVFRDTHTLKCKYCYLNQASLSVLNQLVDEEQSPENFLENLTDEEKKSLIWMIEFGVLLCPPRSCLHSGVVQSLR